MAGRLGVRVRPYSADERGWGSSGERSFQICFPEIAVGLVDLYVPDMTNSVKTYDSQLYHFCCC